VSHSEFRARFNQRLEALVEIPELRTRVPPLVVKEVAVEIEEKK
jgi:hypothetical protein